MKETPIRNIFRAIVRMTGLDPDTASLSAAQKAKYAELVNERIVEAYQFAFWPQVMLIEQRQYRPTWDETENYDEDDEVLHVDADDETHFYRSLQAGNLNKDPDTETTWWEEIDDEIVRTISFTQDDETEIEGVDVRDCCYKDNPKIYPDAQPIEDVHLYGDAILVGADKAPTNPWIRFRPPAPEFSWTEWAAGTAYAIGDLVYLDTYGSTTVGQTFKAIAASTGKNPYAETSYWQPVDFPYFLRTYIKHAVMADLIREDEGRFRQEAKANAELERLYERYIEQSGEVRRAVFVAPS